jgi:hypothetical protein
MESIGSTLPTTLFALFVFLLGLPGTLLAAPLEKAFLGTWAPKGPQACKVGPVVKILPDKIIFQNGGDSAQFGDLDACYTCEGGANYNGIVVWVVPEFSKKSKPFTLYFNADEKRGVLKIEFTDRSLEKRFPLKSPLMKCK